VEIKEKMEKKVLMLIMVWQGVKTEKMDVKENMEKGGKTEDI
jgi:hypothetical protein